MPLKTPKKESLPVKNGLQADFWRSERERLVARGSAAYSSIIVRKAQNSTIWDVDGKTYIDFAGGIGAMNVGHCHPKVVAAVQKQAANFIHSSFHVAAYEPHLELCSRLVAITPGVMPKKCLLINSGSEAIENAVKFARAFTKRSAVISFDNAFHGRTLLCLTLDGKYKPLKQHFGPLAPEVHHAPFPYPYRPPFGVGPQDLVQHCLEELDRLLASDVAPEDVAALIVEPVQGEGGFVVPPAGFLKALRALCDKHGIVLVIDEVQTGFGRTGRLFAIEHEGVVPDILVTAKSLAAGMPLSAVVGRAEIMDAAPTGSVGGTYGGNPVSCAAALAVLDIFKEEDLLAAARRVGDAVSRRFRSFVKNFKIVGDARGLGAMQALELVIDKESKAPLPAERMNAILRSCEERGLLLLKAGASGNVLRTLMPLTIPEAELARGLDILESVLAKA